MTNGQIEITTDSTTTDAPPQANRHCERCAVVEGRTVVYDKSGQRHDYADVRTMRPGEKKKLFGLGYNREYIDLVTIHLDHNAKNNDSSNLQLVCRRCLLAHARQANQRKRMAGVVL